MAVCLAAWLLLWFVAVAAMKANARLVLLLGLLMGALHQGELILPPWAPLHLLFVLQGRVLPQNWA